MSVVTLTHPNPPAKAPIPAFSPQALLNAASNSLTSPLLNNILPVKGVFKAGKGITYSGYYYDSLKDEFTEAAMTLAIPGLLRQQLKDGQLIEGLATLTKRQQATAGRIDLVLYLSELNAKEDRVEDETARRAFEILQQKVEAGFKDAEYSIRKKLFNQEPVNIVIIIGLGAVIDADIRRQLGEATVAYNIQFLRTNLSKSDEIIRTLRGSGRADIVAIACGGGDHLTIFNQPAISEEALTLKSVFVTALGHAVDEPLLQKVADKSFITPTAFGQYLHQLYVQTSQEFNESQVKLMNDLKVQISAGYETRLADMQARLNQVAADSKEANTKVRYLSGQLERSKVRFAVLLTLLAALMVLLIVLLRR